MALITDTVHPVVNITILQEVRNQETRLIKKQLRIKIEFTGGKTDAVP